MAPEMSAAVMIAKVPWKAMNSRWGIAPCALEADAAQPGEGQRADQRAAGGEGQRVAGQRPRHGDRAERHEAHHHRVEGVLGAHHAAVEEAQGRRHQQHQRGGDEHPADVGVVHDDIE